MRGLGRSNQWKDRWGGNFILVAVAIIAAAYFIGTWINQGKDQMTITDPAGVGTDPGWTVNPSSGSGTQNPATTPTTTNPAKATGDNVYFVQVAAVGDEVKAKEFAKGLQEKNYAAYVTGKGPYRINVGTYATRAAAEEMAAQIEAAKIAGLPEKVLVSTLPLREMTLPVTAGTSQGLDQKLKTGMAAVTGYLKEAATWVEGHMSNKPVTADKLNGFSGQIEQLSAELSKNSADLNDPSVAHFMTLAARVSATHQAISGTAAGTLTGHEAMESLMSLAGAYRETPVQ